MTFGLICQIYESKLHLLLLKKLVLFNQREPEAPVINVIILREKVSAMKKIRRVAAFLSAVMISAAAVPVTMAETEVSAAAANVVEYLDRGISAINTGSGMMVSWRFLASDTDNTVFKLYRDNSLIYTSDAGMATSYLDKGGNASSSYRVETISGGKVVSSDECSYVSGKNYFDIPMDVPKGGSGYTYSPNDCSTGDVDEVGS